MRTAGPRAPVPARAPHALLEALALALGVELSVLPPYLYALWSIRPDASPAAAQADRVLRGVVYEEMLHAALVGNLLNSLGSTPSVRDHLVPSWPAPLPGHTTLAPWAYTVHLGPLSHATLGTFLRIEQPEWDVAADPASGWSTIGQLYARVRVMVEGLDDAAFTGTRQLDAVQNPGPGRLLRVVDRASALTAIDIICDQGEGYRPSKPHPADGPQDDDDHEVAHYWQFVGMQRWLEDGVLQPDRDLHPLVRDPDHAALGPAQRAANRRFNLLWDQLLDQLDTMFAATEPRAFGPPTRLMLDLAHAAAVLRAQGPVPGTDRLAGPTFRVADSREQC